MYIKVKRFIDFIVAIVMLIIFSPIMLCVAIAIKVDDFSGPILFKQKRPGKNCIIFEICKFRTMRVEIFDENNVRIPDKQRLTKIGGFLRKTSLDELPQLINVLKGEMSFIGPRPLLVSYLSKYNEEQIRRHDVTPGISGWAQVNGRNSISWEEKFNYDLWYVDNICFKTDCLILLKTLKSVIVRDGVNSSEDVSMPAFAGTNTIDFKEKG